FNSRVRPPEHEDCNRCARGADGDRDLSHCAAPRAALECDNNGRNYYEMTLNTTKTVRELALEMPAATRVFERLKIDYCCGGGRTLEAACAAAGVKIGDVADLLERAKALRDQGGAADEFLSMPLSELVNTYLSSNTPLPKD